ncbi:MAG: hypothetical protein LBT00_13650 [Spirochaetaceae bacterium]|jgi:hypothetical protein|nr:hypothetical protein [Spirochaetaceae bacterium]
MREAIIDRRGLVSRHDPVYGGAVSPSRDAPLSVGNGAFCFTADFTGLQTFAEEGAAFPLCTMAEWGWHRYADAPADDRGLRLEPFDTWGRDVGYAVSDAGQETLFKGLRHNAHKFNLARIGFDTGAAAGAAWIPVRQRLSLWEGVLSSVFSLGGSGTGKEAAVETFAAPDKDALHVRVTSPLVRAGMLRVVIAFPYGSHKKAAGTFAAPRLHTTSIIVQNDRCLVLRRVMDTTVYGVTVTLGEGVSASFDGIHTLTLSGSAENLTFAVHFTAGDPALRDVLGNGTGDGASGKTPPGFDAARLGLSGFDNARAACAAFWAQYWNEGGAVDLGGSTDSRAGELERRIVLSQYLTAIQSRGTLVPAETGLTMNSWYGKFHLEMHCWHQAHFALWGRAAELRKSLALYKRFLPRAREIATSQGYAGARWPKMCDDSGCNTPSSIAVLLVWQQPHPLFLAELCYRAFPPDEKANKAAFLREYRAVVVETAAFMFDFLHGDDDRNGGRYVLGPPLIPVQERFDPRTVLNPAFETAYFRWGLRQANVWLTRLGERPRTDWAEAAATLAPPAVSVKDGLYLAHEHCPDTFTRFNTDHPSMLMMKGVLPGNAGSAGIDDAVMNATLDRVLKDWNWNSLWGWDFPMMAMTACRLGRREDAVGLLLMDSPKNTYLANGHNQQAGASDLPLYLPGNGGLLLATAMMTAGYDGSGPLPGFPENGRWQVRYEGILPSP